MEFGSRTIGLRPGPPLETLIFRTKCHLLVWAKIKRKVTGITSCAYSLEHILLGEKKRCFCLGFASKKESSVCFILIWNKPHSEFSDPGGKKKSSGIWRKQMDPRLQSREECLGNQKNIMVSYKFLVRFQPAALSWILCKTPGTLVNWKVTWIIVGLGPYYNDEVREKKKKKNRFAVRGSEGRRGLWSGTEDGGESLSLGEWWYILKKLSVHSLCKEGARIWFRSKEG